MVGLKHEVQEQQRKIEALRAEQFQLLKKAQKAEAEAAEAQSAAPGRSAAMARRSLRLSAACHGVGVRRRSLLAGRGLFSCVPGGEREAAAGEGSEGAPRRPGSASVPLLRHELQQQLLELERGAHLA